MGEVRINSSKLREEHVGIWKNGGVFLLYIIYIYIFFFFFFFLRNK